MLSIMGSSAFNLFCSANPICSPENKCLNSNHFLLSKNSISGNPTTYKCQQFTTLRPVLAVSECSRVEGDMGAAEVEEPKYRWVKKNIKLNEEQTQALSQVSPKMSNRCKALMKQIICYSPENGSVELMLSTWTKSTNPERADWLSILKELDKLNHSMYFEVAELALCEESFEANIRDYTKMIHGYAKQGSLKEAENTLLAMKKRGFICDQVTLTTLIHMYSKAGNLNLAEDSFEEMRLLGVALDKRSYGSMIMAYIRAGMLGNAENLLQEMESQDIHAGREVYKALLRAYSMTGNSIGAQRVFDAAQLAGVIPDARVCGLLMNAYLQSGQAREACVVFENMRRAGLEPNDKCVALLVSAYAHDDRLKEALDFLIELERENIVLGKETSELLVSWFSKLGIVEEVELALRDFSTLRTSM